MLSVLAAILFSSIHLQIYIAPYVEKVSEVLKHTQMLPRNIIATRYVFVVDWHSLL